MRIEVSEILIFGLITGIVLGRYVVNGSLIVAPLDAAQIVPLRKKESMQ